MSREAVVLVHGLWMHGLIMRWLAKRLQEAGYLTREFSYHTVSHSVDENANALRNFIKDIDADRIHLVGHSLGGIVILHMLNRYPETVSGRVVLLGSPLRGSRVAAAMASKGLGRLLGKSQDGGLVEPAEFGEWNGRQELGLIAGTRAFGVGQVIHHLPRPHDGTVAVEETEISGARDRLLLPVTHTSMLFSKDVANAVRNFLRQGVFSIPAQ